MRESKAVILGFGFVAFVMIAFVTYVWLGATVAMHPSNAHLDDPLSIAFRSEPYESNGSVRQVPAVEALLPVGKPAAEAIGMLKADDFKCSRKAREVSCARTVTGSSTSDKWMVSMTFDASDHLVARSATRQGTSL